MSNPYFDEFQELREKSTFRGEQWFGKRKELVEKYSWGIPNEEALVYLSEFDNIVEVGAGSGYWANCIEEEGGSVRATDIEPPKETFTNVKQAAVHDLDLSDKVVLSVWPPVGSSMAFYALQQDPAHFIYVGEPRGGCTAADSFFDTVERKYGLVARIELPSYAGANDDLYHYVRNI